jgi:tRNA nucleotidyltransferase (CCA-adding enzyme)
MEAFEVGGCVRDEILGVKSKDIDYSVVLDDDDIPAFGTTVAEPDYFDIMVNELTERGFRIFLETPEHFTVRAQFPKVSGHARSGITADFVLARREGPYSDGRRPDWVKPGELLDDLARRDFTMNAIAKDSRGTLIDPFDGVQDINDRVIRAVGKAFDRLNEDALRAVRALRFSVTKGFRIDPEVRFAMESASVLNALEAKISDERIHEELSKMFRFDTLASLDALARFPALTRVLFSGKVSLDSTMKQKGRGK